MDGSAFDTQQVAPAHQAMPFDLNVIIATFRRRLRLFAAVALAVFVAVLLYTLQETPRYTASAQVMLDVRQEQVTDMSTVLSGLPADSSVVDTEVEVLRSRSLAGRVVDQLKLEQDPYFNPSLAGARGVASWFPWLKKAVAIDTINSTVTLVRPQGDFKYGFFYLKDNRNISVSSDFIIN